MLVAREVGVWTSDRWAGGGESRQAVEKRKTVLIGIESSLRRADGVGAWEEADSRFVGEVGGYE